MLEPGSGGGRGRGPVAVFAGSSTHATPVATETRTIAMAFHIRELGHLGRPRAWVAATREQARVISAEPDARHARWALDRFE